MNRASSRPAGTTEEDRVRRRRRLGQAIKDYRRDMPQADLGMLLGDIPQTTISRWERGLVDLTLEQLHDLETVLKLTPGTLLVASGYAVMRPEDVDPLVALQHDRTLDPSIRPAAIATYRSWQDVSRTLAAKPAKSRAKAATK